MRKYYSDRYLEELLKQVEPNIGNQSTIFYDNMEIDVVIKEAAIKSRKVQLLISPVSGKGETWVECWQLSLKLDMEKLNTIYREDEQKRLEKTSKKSL